MTAAISLAFLATKPGVLIMIGRLLLRGMLVGIVAGLLAFGFAKVFGEPMVEQAIALEGMEAHEHGEAGEAHEEAELVSREVQSTLGLLTGIVVYGTAIGGLFALAFVAVYGRVGHLGPRAVAALLAGAAFLAVYLVPDLKYPANPPAVGLPETIGYRTGLYFFMVAFSIVAMGFAVTLWRRLGARLGTWNSGLVASVAFVVVIGLVQMLLPDINEVPAEFPAVLLWKFRIASLGIQATLWAVIGLSFGYLAERLFVEEQEKGVAFPARGSRAVS